MTCSIIKQLEIPCDKKYTLAYKLSRKTKLMNLHKKSLIWISLDEKAAESIMFKADSDLLIDSN